MKELLVTGNNKNPQGARCFENVVCGSSKTLCRCRLSYSGLSVWYSFQIVVHMHPSVPIQCQRSLIFHRNDRLGHNKFAEHVSTFTFNSLPCFCKLVPNARYFCENSMIDAAAMVLKDTKKMYICTLICNHTCTSNYGLGVYEVILAKFSSSLLLYPFDGHGLLWKVSDKGWGRAKIHVKSDIPAIY